MSKKLPRLGLLDTVFVLLMAVGLILILLWLASRITGQPILEDLAPWLSQGMSALWGFLTTGIAFLMAYIKNRSRNSEDVPHYLGWVFATVMVFFLLIFGCSRLLLNPPSGSKGGATAALGEDSKWRFNFQVWEHYRVTGDSIEARNRVGFLQYSQWQPSPNIQGNLVTGIDIDPRDSVFRLDIAFPAKHASYEASVKKFVQFASLGTAEQPAHICLTLPEKSSSHTVDLHCGLGLNQGCRLSPDAPKGIRLCSDDRTGFRNFHLIPSAYAQPAGHLPLGWRVPSLQTLESRAHVDSLMYTRFEVSVRPEPGMHAAFLRYRPMVNGVPIFIDGWPQDYNLVAVGESETIALSWGLENLDFSGADKGLESMALTVEYLDADRKMLRADTLHREYIALRQPDTVRLESESSHYTWSGTFHNAGKNFEIFLTSSPVLTDVASGKKNLTAAGYAFGGKDVVGVIRPPLGNNKNYGLVFGLRQANGQIQFNFDQGQADSLCAWAMRTSGQGGSPAFKIRRDLYRYELNRGHRIAFCKDLGA